MQDTHTLVTMDQDEKNKASAAIITELNAAVSQLQEDIVE
jgi:hypothetical protein